MKGRSLKDPHAVSGGWIIEGDMELTYDPEADALYIRFVEEKGECRVVRLTEQVAVDFGPKEEVVGIEVLDASRLWKGLEKAAVRLENLVAA